MAADIEIREGVELGSPADMLYDMDRMMERFFTEPFGSSYEAPLVPRRVISELKETDDSYIMQTDVPGIAKEDINVNVNGNVLTISARSGEAAGSKESARRDYRSFRQTYSLPSTIDAEKIEAHCENGVLEVLLPKVSAAQAKKIEVQSGKGGFWSRLTAKKSEPQLNESISRSISQPKKH